MIELVKMVMLPMMMGMLSDPMGTIEMILPLCNLPTLVGMIGWLLEPGVLSHLIHFVMDMMLGAVL
jgi:hypothetical protein